MDEDNTQTKALNEYEAAVSRGFAPVGSSPTDIKQRGSAVMEAATTLAKQWKISLNAARWRVRRAVERSGGTEMVTESNDPELYAASEIEGLKVTTRSLRAQLRDLKLELDEARNLRQHAFGLTPAKVRADSWSVVELDSSNQLETPIIFTSDLQCGEVIRAEDTRGENEYNLAIFRERYRTMISVAVNLIEKHHGGAEHVIYLRGGDAISGGIHDELKDTDEVPPPEQCIALIQEEVGGIRNLAEKFGRVTVISVGGNHDRTTAKPRTKQYARHSYEMLIQFSIEAHFKHDNRVNFITDESGDVLFKVHDYSMLLTHGDRIGVGTNKAGRTAATILDGARKIKAAYLNEGQHIDLVLLGHFHISMHAHGLVMSNGTLAGIGEFARTRMRAERLPPTQTLFFVHRDRGVTATRLIDVNHKPRKTEGPTKVV